MSRRRIIGLAKTATGDVIILVIGNLAVLVCLLAVFAQVWGVAVSMA